jgi:7-keto-8-aminopelargonate synthetase-like enzyme
MAKNIEANGGPLVFGGPIPPALLGASIASADIHLSPEVSDLQSDLRQRIRMINALASEMGISFATDEETPIWFVEVGATRRAVEMASRMLESGFYVNPSAFPVVPRGHAGVRFTVTNHNSMETIESMLTRLNELRLEMVGETEVVVDLTDDATAATAGGKKEKQEPSQG